jgi:hypothetical protein
MARGQYEIYTISFRPLLTETMAREKYERYTRFSYIMYLVSRIHKIWERKVKTLTKN